MGPERDHLQCCIAQPLAHPTISLEAEVPEVLLDGMREFLAAHPHWDQMELITSALAGFLFQNGCSDRQVSEHYLNGLFRASR
jgi:hypothetical protein